MELLIMQQTITIFGEEETENISVVDGKIYVSTLGILYEVGGLVPAE